MERGRRRGQGLVGFPLVSFLMMIVSSLSASIHLILISGQPKIVNAYHVTSMCVQLGQANGNTWYVGWYNDTSTVSSGISLPRDEYTFYFRFGYWTIGARKFDTKFSFLDYSYGNNPEDLTEPDYTGFYPEEVYPKRRRRRNILKRRDGVAYHQEYYHNSTNYISARNQNKAAPGPRPPKPPKPSHPPGIHDFVYPDPKTGGCPYEWYDFNPGIDWCPEDDHVEIRTYAVKEVIPDKPDRVLNGWLYFEIELKDTTPGDEILAIYVQVRDEFFNAIGEFVSDRKEQCPNRTGKDFAQPTPYQVLPCSAIGFREAKLSNALFMAREQALKYPAKMKPGYLPPDQQMRYGIRFTWRLSEYWCNRHLRFRPEAIIFTKKNAFINRRTRKPYILRKAANYWIKHKWYGAADIKREYTTLSCDEPAINYQTGEILKSPKNTSIQAAPWFETSIFSMYKDDYMYPYQWIPPEPAMPGQPWTWMPSQLKSCQFNTRVGYPLHPGELGGKPFPETVKDIVPTFAGRCTHHYKKDPNHDALQGCNLNRNGEEFKDLIAEYPNIPTYTSFVHTLTTNRTRLCTVPCHPPTLQNLSEILAYKDNSGESQFSTYTTYHNDERLNRKFEQFFVGRKYHAMLCIYWTMFLMPVGIFVARYLKETFMNVSCIGGHLWFWVHFASSVLSVMLFLSSLTGISQTLDTWGRSTHSYGMAHAILGYMSVGLFMLMVVIGGLRGLHERMRYVMMTIHSVIGFMIYFLNIIVMILSVYIPASPSMGDDCLSDGTPKDTGKVIIVISIWIAMDLFLHAAMNIMQCLTDQAVGIRRRWWCPIIPILPADAVEDMVGSYFRKMTMLAYGIAAFIMANTAAGIVIAHTPANEACLKLTGPRTCKKPWGCSASAEAYLKHVLASSKSTNGSYVYVEH